MVSCDIKQIWIINTFSCIYCAAQIINAIMIETKRATVQACNSINTKHDKGELYSFKQRKQHINQSLATHTSSNMHQVFHTYGGNLHWITFYVCEQNFVLILSPILIKKRRQGRDMRATASPKNTLHLHPYTIMFVCSVENVGRSSNVCYRSCLT